jgi:hypothetical protein
MTIHLSCGHSAHTTKPTRVGIWISCWALMYPAAGCQTQRKVVKVTLEPQQLALWEAS